MKKLVQITGVFVLVLIALAGWTAYRYLVFHGATEPVTFDSNGFTLSGLLVKPERTGRLPAIVVLHGSGPHTHDMVPYRIHANSFVREGFAVLLYDKRGVGNSEGDFETATYADFIQDAVAAVGFLRGRQDIDTNRIGLFGSSEGGWFTPEVAITVDNIAFVINRCGPPLPWDVTNLWEIRNELIEAGFDDSEIEQILALRMRLWQFYRDAATDPNYANGSARDTINAELVALSATLQPKDLPLPSKLPDFDVVRYSRLAADNSYDPTPFLHQIDLPMLFVFAQNDVNLPTRKSVEVLEALKNDMDKNVTVKVYPNIGHSLQTWTRPLSIGYDDGYLDLIGEWAREQIDAQD